MSLANLGDLEDALSDWLFRSGDAALSARAADFITLFEADFLIDPEMRTPEMEEVSTAPISSAIIPLPSDFLDMKVLRVLGSALNIPDTKLDYITPSQAADLDSTTATSGTVQNYTLRAGRIFLSPQRWAPVGASLELTYNQFVPLASSSGGVNWLLRKYPNLYLYGSLMHAAAFVDDKQTVAQWKNGRDEAMAKLARTLVKRKLGAGPLAQRASSASFR